LLAPQLAAFAARESETVYSVPKPLVFDWNLTDQVIFNWWKPISNMWFKLLVSRLPVRTPVPVGLALKNVEHKLPVYQVS
jgi:hypothetical protein